MQRKISKMNQWKLVKLHQRRCEQVHFNLVSLTARNQHSYIILSDGHQPAVRPVVPPPQYAPPPEQPPRAFSLDIITD